MVGCPQGYSSHACASYDGPLVYGGATKHLDREHAPETGVCRQRLTLGGKCHVDHRPTVLAPCAPLEEPIGCGACPALDFDITVAGRLRTGLVGYQVV